jgi:uncharacterized protein DUF5667
MHHQDADLGANDDVEDLLEAYAEARLMPASPVLARIRSTVLAAATERAASMRLTLAPAPAQPGPRFAILRSPLVRPVFAVGFSLSLSLGIGLSVLAAPPGSALYNARLSIESALLPPVTDLDARLAAYEEQFDRRLVEADAAVASGDESALAAALAAYQQEVTNAVAEIGEAADRLARLEAVLAKHIAKLQELSVRLPTDVARANAVDHAILASERAVAKLKERQSPSHGGGGRPQVPPGLESTPPNRP